MPWLVALLGSPSSLVVLALVVLLLFGNRLPALLRSLGRSVVEFRRGLGALDDDPDAPERRSLKK